MSQSTVSKHIAALEERLGTKLLNRSTRSLSLTEAGTEYYHYCVRILNDFQEAEASIGKGRIKPTGTLRLSSTVPFGRKFIIPFLGDFLKQYPDIEIDYLMEDREIDLVKEGVDVAIRVGPLADSSLVARKIGSSRRLVVASPEYLIKHGFPKTPSDLKSHGCLLYSLLKSQNEWFFSSAQFGDESVLINGRFKASSNEALCEAAISGLGIATMCEWHVREHIKNGRLTVLLKNYELTPYDINAVYPERRYMPEKVKRLIDHLKECFKDYE
jgi:LysR family transcriptional regulator for bpeEF and oprC